MASKQKSNKAGKLIPGKKAGSLRTRAERSRVKTRRKITQLPVADMAKLVHELQVHQLELEIQNEELRRTQLALETARDRHADLDNFAPTAHLTLNARGEIVEANLNAGKLLGLERGRLLHQKFSRFVTAETQRVFRLLCRQVFRADARQGAELELVNGQAKRLFIQVEAVRDTLNRRKQCRFSFVDITERKRAEEALRESSQFNQQIIAGAKEGIIVNGPDLKHLVWNPFMEELTGMPAAQVLGKHPAEVFPFLRDTGVISQLNRALAGETVAPMDVPFHIPQSGRSGWASNSSGPLRNAKGEIIGVIGIVTDITERKQAEERIAQLNRAQAILAGIDRAIVHISDQQKLLDEACRVAVEKGGFKLAWVGMITPDGSVQPVAQSGATEYLEGIRVVTHNGPAGRGAIGTAIRENRTVVIEDIARNTRMAPWHQRARQFGLQYVAALPLRRAGKVVGTFQVYAPRADFFDATELNLLNQVSADISFALTAMADLAARKQAEAALRHNEHQLSNFFNQAPIGLVWLAADGTILRANQAQLDLVGYPAADYLGHSFNEFSADPAQGQELLNRLAAQQTVRNFPMTRRRKDGQIRQVLVDADSFWNDEQFQYSSLFLRDITDRLELERGILQATEREHRRIAQDLHDGLGQLLAGTAYLTSTLRQKLAAQSLPEAGELGRILEVIYEAIAQTRNLARGIHPVEPEPNGLMAALQTLAERTKKLFQVGCRCTGRQPVLIQDNTVATHLFRIAQEAITNAIKHGQPGRITIGLTETRGGLQLTIKDDGTGLPARSQKKSGMGLRIMRYRAGMIGGSLTLQQPARGGTVVLCTVPRSMKAAGHPAQK